uniref:Uncharacterized protein n=2 Tax=Leptobrachium leishanense TaxID=445787 RepID=A0A8C5LVR9_9ANUR
MEGDGEGLRETRDRESKEGLRRKKEITRDGGLMRIMQATMNTVSVQPMAVTQTVTMVQANGWSTGICDCCDDCGICCCAFWCFPCFQCKTSDEFGECLCLPLLESGCLGYFGISGTAPCISLAIRSSARERYRIHGSICNDCCLVCCCMQCSWCQIAREIKKRKQPFTLVTAQTTNVVVPNYNQFNNYPPSPSTKNPPPNGDPSSPALLPSSTGQSGVFMYF